MKIDVRWPARVWQIKLHKLTVEFDWMHDIRHQQQKIWIIIIIIIIFSSVLKPVYINVQSMHAIVKLFLPCCLQTHENIHVTHQLRTTDLKI